MKIGGAILCGGKSSRMGKPKAWLELSGETFLHRIVRIVSSVADPVVVVAARGQELPPLPCGIERIDDAFENCGPLVGLLAAMEAMQDRADAFYASSCDVPLLKAEFASAVIAGLNGDCDIAVPIHGGFRQPLAAAYRTNLAASARSLVEAGRLRPGCLFELHTTRDLEASHFSSYDPELESMRNVNTPEEYAALLRDCGSITSSSRLPRASAS